MMYSVVQYLDRSVYPRADRPDEVRAAELIVSLHRSGCSRQSVVQAMNQVMPGAARSGRWNARLVSSVIRRQAGRRRI